MENKNMQASALNGTARIYAAVAVPLRFLTLLFAPVIDLLINLPVMNAVWRERRELELVLTNAHCNDMGLSADCIRQEISKSYFDIPQDRKRSCSNANAIRYHMPF